MTRSNSGLLFSGEDETRVRSRRLRSMFKALSPLSFLRFVASCVSASAGFLEIGETGEEGAAREAREEMNAEIDVGGLLAVYCLPHIGQT